MHSKSEFRKQYKSKEQILLALNEVERSIMKDIRHFSGLSQESLHQFFADLIPHEYNLEDLWKSVSRDDTTNWLYWQMCNKLININPAQYDCSLRFNIKKWVQLRLILIEENFSLDEYRNVNKQIELENLKKEFSIEYYIDRLSLFFKSSWNSSDANAVGQELLSPSELKLMASTDCIFKKWAEVQENGYDALENILAEERESGDYKDNVTSPELVALKVFAEIILGRHLDKINWAEQFVQKLNALGVQKKYHVLFEFLYDILALQDRLSGEEYQDVTRFLKKCVEAFLTKAEILFRQGECVNFWQDISAISNETKQKINSCFSAWDRFVRKYGTLRDNIKPIKLLATHNNLYKSVFTHEEVEGMKKSYQGDMLARNRFCLSVKDKFEETQNDVSKIVGNLKSSQLKIQSLSSSSNNYLLHDEVVKEFHTLSQQLEQTKEMAVKLSSKLNKPLGDNGASETSLRNKIVKKKLAEEVLAGVVKGIESFNKGLKNLVDSNIFPDFDYNNRWLDKILQEVENYENSMNWRTKKSRREQVKKFKQALNEARKDNTNMDNVRRVAKALQFVLKKERKIFFKNRKSELLQIVDSVCDIFGKASHRKIQDFAGILLEGSAEEITKYRDEKLKGAISLQSFFMTSDLEPVLHVIAECQQRGAYQKVSKGDFAARSLLTQTVLDLFPNSHQKQNICFIQSKLDGLVAFFQNPESGFNMSFSGLTDGEISALIDFILKEFTLLSCEDLVEKHIPALSEWTYMLNDARWQSVRDLINDKLVTYIKSENVKNFVTIQERLDKVAALPWCNNVVLRTKLANHVDKYIASIISKDGFFWQTDEDFDFLVKHRGFKFNGEVYPKWMREGHFDCNQILGLVKSAKTSAHCAQLKKWLIDVITIIAENEDAIVVNSDARHAKFYLSKFVKAHANYLLQSNKYSELDSLLQQVLDRSYFTDKYKSYFGAKKCNNLVSTIINSVLKKNKILSALRKCASIKAVFELLALWSSDPLMQILQKHQYFNGEVLKILQKRYRKLLITDKDLLHIIKREGVAFVYSGEVFEIERVGDYIRLMNVAAGCKLELESILALMPILNRCQELDKWKEKFSQAKQELFKSFLEKGRFDLVVALYKQNIFYEHKEIIMEIVNFFKISFNGSKIQNLATFHAELAKAGMTSAIWNEIYRNSEFSFDDFHHFFMVNCLKNDAKIAHKFFLENIWQCTDENKVAGIITSYIKVLQDAEYNLDVGNAKDKNVKCVQHVIGDIKKESGSENTVLIKAVGKMLKQDDVDLQSLYPMIMLIGPGTLEQKYKIEVKLSKLPKLCEQMRAIVNDGGKMSDDTLNNLSSLYELSIGKEKIDSVMVELDIASKMRKIFDPNGKNFLRDLNLDQIENCYSLVRKFGSEEQQQQMGELEDSLYNLYGECVSKSVLQMVAEVFEVLEAMRKYGDERFEEIEKSHKKVMSAMTNVPNGENSTKVVEQIQLESSIQRLEQLVKDSGQEDITIPNSFGIEKKYIRMAEAIRRVATYIKSAHEVNAEKAYDLKNQYDADIKILFKHNPYNEQFGLHDDEDIEFVLALKKPEVKEIQENHENIVFEKPENKSFHSGVIHVSSQTSHVKEQKRREMIRSKNNLKMAEVLRAPDPFEMIVDLVATVGNAFSKK